MITRTQLYVSALLSNPKFIEEFIIPLANSFYAHQNKDIAATIAEVVAELEDAFDMPIHVEPSTHDESEDLAP